MKKIKYLMCLALAGSMFFGVPVMAEEGNSENITNSVIDTEYFGEVEYDFLEPTELSNDQISALFGERSEIQPLSTTPDKYEPNNTISTAVPYNNVAVLTSQLSGTNQLYTLGMRSANLHSETDEDWYTVELNKDEICFVDLRNVGQTNIFIELYYIRSDGTGYFYSTDPYYESVFENKPEKYFYFTSTEADKSTYYIRVANGGGWTEDMMNYYFYVGPAVQEFDIVNLNTGTVQIWGDDYRTYTYDLSRNVVPSTTAIEYLSVTDAFPQGNACSEIQSYISAGGQTYYENSAGSYNGIKDASLGQRWTLGAKCSKGQHFTYWSARLNGRFKCIMEPYPGNELDF